jgi:hypothetical protein
MAPYSALGIYRGLASDDDAMVESRTRALISIQPLYKNYVPRLMERFHKEEENDQLLDYLLNISTLLLATAANELGSERMDQNPMDLGFFE